MTQVGHFDIVPSSSSNGYNGAWSTYPYFPSSRVKVSGIKQGLYVLESSVPTASPSTSPSVVPTVAHTSQPTIGIPSTTSTPSSSPSSQPITSFLHHPHTTTNASIQSWSIISTNNAKAKQLPNITTPTTNNGCLPHVNRKQ